MRCKFYNQTVKGMGGFLGDIEQNCEHSEAQNTLIRIGKKPFGWRVWKGSNCPLAPVCKYHKE